ncbi:MAG: EamA family transporter RarD [Alphaproteobacteria bacterium]|nr:EamA family transporter RarD [Alphaproteobacteria bacterium]
MTQSLRLGFLCCLGCYTIWGTLPLYFRALGHIAPMEMLAHRIIWSVPTGLMLIVLANNWQQLRAAMTRQHVLWLSISALLIGLNWLAYIWAVSQERVMEASLGYYINPLVNVLIGAVFFAERLRPAQWSAVGLAGIGVGVMTYALGYFPWVALVLCISFALYSVIRKQVQVDSRAGFVVEAAILAPLALLWMGWFVGSGDGRLIGEGGWDIPLLLASGPITAVPLILFAIAAKRLRLSTIGMMQYIGPTLQFLISVFVFKEAFALSHAIAFAFIWTALFVFTFDSLVGEAKARRLARAAASVR